MTKRKKIARPTHTQLMLPLLETIEAEVGSARPRDPYDAVAEKLGVPPEIRNEVTATANGRVHNVFERHIRWARQTAVRKGLIGAPERGVWALTEKGEGALQTAVVAERLGRRWVGSDRSFVYLNGASFRFPAARIPAPEAADTAA